MPRRRGDTIFGTARGGMTLLEVVLSVTILGLVAATAATALGFMIGRQERQQQRLAAAEIASRLVLMYLDDDASLPSPTRTIPYGRWEFRFGMTNLPVELREADGVVALRGDGGRRTPLNIDRLRQLTMRVWLSEESGGTRDGSGNEPRYTLVRLYDPLAFGRNPDSARRQFEGEESRQRLFQQFIDAMGGGGG